METVPPLLDWEVVEAPLEGQTVSGDACLVRNATAGCLIVVLDGLGHGSEAHEASNAACEALEDLALPPEDLHHVFRVAHNAARRTRGTAMTALWFDRTECTVTWGAVGNVDGLLILGTPPAHRRERLLLRGGVVGHQHELPRLKAVPLDAGDLVVVATDGIREDFARHEILTVPNLSVAHIARTLFHACQRPNDDALLFVARFQPEAC